MSAAAEFRVKQIGFLPDDLGLFWVKLRNRFADGSGG